MFSESLPGDHDWYRGLGDEVVTEGSEQDTAAVNIMQALATRRYLPFQRIAAPGPEDYESGLKEVNLGYLSDLRRSLDCVWLNLLLQ